MSYNESDYAQIDAFVHDRLPEEEKQAVVQRLQTDPDFAAEVTWLRALLSNYQQLRTRETVNEINQRLRTRQPNSPVASQSTPTADRPAVPQSAPQPVRRRANMAWVAAASIAIVLLSVGLWFVFQQPDSRQAVVQQHTQTSQSRPTPTPTVVEPTPTLSPSDRTMAYVNAPPKLSGAIPSAVKPAADALNANKPDAALRLLKRVRIPRSAPARTQEEEPLFGASPEPAPRPGVSATQAGRIWSFRQFYTGLSYLQKKQPDLALRALNTVSGSLSNTANWYEALCYLQLNQIETGKQRLRQIASNPAHPYQANAKELLTQF